MLHWIAQHEAALNVLLNLGMLLIWLVYAHLLFIEFQRQRRPRLLINRGKRKDVNALCIISNMSAEAIYLEYIIAKLETSHGTITMNVTEFEQDLAAEDAEQSEHNGSTSRTPHAIRENTRQGPLGSGEFIHIGTFGGLIRRLARSAKVPMQGDRPKGDIEFKCLIIQLIVLYGSEDKPISAERRFEFCTAENVEDAGALSPATWDTSRGSSYAHRQKLCQQLNWMNKTDFTFSSTIKTPNSKTDE
ncbi:MAG: hypothetical protein WED11_05970 [Natronospirillum sp.]